MSGGDVLDAAGEALPDVLAVFFIISYLGMGLPSIAFSQVIQHAALKPSMIVFAAALSVGAVGAVNPAIRSARR